MARTNQISKGPGFLAGTSLSHLNRLYKEERDAKAKLRLLACIKRKEGYTIPQMSSFLKVAPSTISDWLIRIQKHGLERRKNKKQEGRPCWMTPQQLAQLSSELVQDPRSFGFSQSMWTTTMVIRHVQKRYHISYAARSMRKILTKLGFSPKKPRTSHYKSASESDRMVFKKKQEGPSPHTQKDTPRSVWTSQRT